MSYVDGYVIVIPKKNRAAYKKMAKEGKQMWMKRGALDYKECRIDDAKPKEAHLTFNKLTKVKPTEEVWFSYIVYKNKKHRDEVNKAVQGQMIEWAKKSGKSKKEMMAMMPFDMKKMAYAGFTVEVE